MGAGKIIEGLVEALGREAPAAENAGIRAFHGSPHSFDRFDMSKIGTGEGAQAYGHGLYFAENEGVARGYRDALAPAPTAAQEAAQRGLDAHGGDANAAADEIANMIKDGNLLPETVDHYKTVEAILRGEASAKPGHVYEVSINADPNTFLDWDKPLSEQPPAIADALRKIGFEDAKWPYTGLIGPNSMLSKHSPGQEIYNAVGKERGSNSVGRPRDINKAGASEALKEAGIPGIKYLDAGSRYTPANLPNNLIANAARQFLDAAQGDGEKALQLFRDSNPVEHWSGSERDEITKVIKSAAKPVTRNYVVFDDKLISIVRKYGIAGASALLGYDILANAHPAQAEALKQADTEAQANPQGYAGGGLIEKLVGAVAKEAPAMERGAARRATINIGLDINGGEKLAPEEALAAIQRYGVRPISAKIAQSDTEPTLVVELDRALKPDEANELSAALRQEAIAQVDETGVGDLYGPMADKWKPFNGDYFITHSGERLGSSQVLDGLKQISGEPVEKAGGGLIEDAAKMLLGAAKKGEEKTAQTMRMYHGRAFHKPIQQLDPLISANQLGIHLGDAPTASMFAPIRDNVKPTDAGGRVIPLDVTINNPLRLMDNTGKWNPDDVYKQLVDKGLIQRDSELESRLAWARKGYSVDEEGTLIDDENAPLNAMLEIQDIIRGLGHDGVVYKNRYEFPDEAAQSRAEMRDRSELNSLSDEDFAKEFPEATDSYIAFRRDQLKSPFGDGPGVGYAGGGVVRKLGSGIAELLDFSGVHTGNQIRDDIVRGTELRGDGRKFTNFFGDVTSGASEKYKPHGLDNYDPAITLDEDAARFRALRDGYSGNFDNHIKTSIPGFDETQNAVGSSLLKTYGKNGGDILDIGSSEGALIKALSAASDGRIRTTGIDPNPAMLRTYLEKPQAPGSQSILSAFGSADDAGKLAWEEADGTPIHYFDPGDNKYDAAHEAMVFQFISNARRAQAERMKQLLKPNGLAIFEEKFGNPKAIFDANEAKKDAYKAKYYTPEQMEIKRKEVLNTGNDAVEGMTDLQVSQAEMEKILRDTFKHRAQFWDSGNFKGYAASDDLRALEDYLNNLQSLDSEYATARTPRGFADGGQVSPDQDIADWEFLNNYVASQPEDIQSMTHVGAKPRRPVTMETFGHEFDLGDAPYDVAPSMSTMAQAANDGARMGIYAVPGAGPFIGAGLDTAEAVATGDPTAAVMAAGFGPGGKMAKAALAGTLAYGVDPTDAEAGLFGRSAKWAMGGEGKDALNMALKMSSQGADNVDTFARTGWFKDLDGHWKFWRPSTGGGLIEPFRGNKLADVYRDPFLFDEYPHMKDIGFRRKNEEGAHWDGPNNEIVLGDTSKPGYNLPDAGGRYGTMTHEVYHAKAEREGWPQGTSVSASGQTMMNDMNKMYGVKTDPSVKALADELFQSSGGTGLTHMRYEAEVGEALARREAKMREFRDDNLRGISPADTSLLDVPADTLFHPGENLDPDKYRALLRYKDQELANMQKAIDSGQVYFGKGRFGPLPTKPKRRR